MTNQIGILGSFTLNKQTLNNLSWKVFYFKKVLLTVVDLHKSAPFEVTLKEGSINIASIPIFIRPISDNSYSISVDEEVRIDGEKTRIFLQQNGTFGTLFENEYFNFVINRTKLYDFDPEMGYHFMINDLNKLASAYREHMSIGLIDDESDLVQLKLVGSQPAKEVDYLNELTSVYIKFDLDQKNRISDNTVQFIDLQLSGVIDSLQLANSNFTNFRSRNQIIDLSQEGTIVVDRLEQLENEKAMANLRFEYYKNLLDYLDNSVEMEQMAVPSVVGITDPVLNSTVAKLSELYSKRSILSLTVTNKNPMLISVKQEISYTKKILEENLKNLISNTSSELRNIEIRGKDLNRQLARLPKTEQDMVNIKREFDINNELYTFLLQKRAEAAIAKASNIPDAQILDPARVETAIPLGLNNKVLLFIGLLIGFGIPAVIIVVQELLNKTISSKEEVERNTNISILGGVTHNKGKIEMPVLKYPKSPITESFRSLRTNLKYMLSEEDQKIISVHSSIKGEGKTFISVNLALIIAMNDKKVLLVAGDLRKPRLHKIFNCSNDTGLSSFLIKKDDFNNIIIKSEFKNLNLVMSGPIPPNPAELIENGQFEKFLEQAKERYDYIIIDNAPSFIVTDGILIGKKANLNLFVVRLNKSYKDHLKVINNLGGNGATNKIGIVVNDIKSDKYGVYTTYRDAYK